MHSSLTFYSLPSADAAIIFMSSTIICRRCRQCDSMKPFFHPSSFIPRHRLCRYCHHIHSSFIFYSPSFTDAVIHIIHYRVCPPSFTFYSLSSADAAIIPPSIPHSSFTHYLLYFPQMLPSYSCHPISCVSVIVSSSVSYTPFTPYLLYLSQMRPSYSCRRGPRIRWAGPCGWVRAPPCCKKVKPFHLLFHLYTVSSFYCFIFLLFHLYTVSSLYRFIFFLFYLWTLFTISFSRSN